MDPTHLQPLMDNLTPRLPLHPTYNGPFYRFLYELNGLYGTHRPTNRCELSGPFPNEMWYVVQFDCVAMQLLPEVQITSRFLQGGKLSVSPGTHQTLQTFRRYSDETNENKKNPSCLIKVWKFPPYFPRKFSLKTF